MPDEPNRFPNVPPAPAPPQTHYAAIQSTGPLLVNTGGLKALRGEFIDRVAFNGLWQEMDSKEKATLIGMLLLAVDADDQGNMTVIAKRETDKQTGERGIADVAGRTVSDVYQAINLLIGKGLIRTYGGGGPKSRVYQLVMPPENSKPLSQEQQQRLAQVPRSAPPPSPAQPKPLFSSDNLVSARAETSAHDSAGAERCAHARIPAETTLNNEHARALQQCSNAVGIENCNAALQQSELQSVDYVRGQPIGADRATMLDRQFLPDVTQRVSPPRPPPIHASATTHPPPAGKLVMSHEQRRQCIVLLHDRRCRRTGCTCRNLPFDRGAIAEILRFEHFSPARLSGVLAKADWMRRENRFKGCELGWIRTCLERESFTPLMDPELFKSRNLSEHEQEDLGADRQREIARRAADIVLAHAFSATLGDDDRQHLVQELQRGLPQQALARAPDYFATRSSISDDAVLDLYYAHLKRKSSASIGKHPEGS